MSEKEYGSIDDLINNETQREEFEYDGKMYWIEYDEKLTNEELWRLIDNYGDLNNGDIKLHGFIPAYIHQIVNDSSIERLKTATKKGDPEFNIKLLQIVGNPLKEIEKLDNIEAEGNLNER